MAQRLLPRVYLSPGPDEYLLRDNKLMQAFLLVRLFGLEMTLLF